MPWLLMWITARVHHVIFIVIHMAPGKVHMAPGEVHMAPNLHRMIFFVIRMAAGEVWRSKNTHRSVFFALRCVYFALRSSSGTVLILVGMLRVAPLEENPWWGVAGGTIWLMRRSHSPAEGGGGRPRRLRRGLKTGGNAEGVPPT